MGGDAQMAVAIILLAGAVVWAMVAVLRPRRLLGGRQ